MGWQDDPEVAPPTGKWAKDPVIGEDKPSAITRFSQGFNQGFALPNLVAQKAREALTGVLNLPHRLVGAPEITTDPKVLTEGFQGVLQDVNKLTQDTVSGLRGEGFAKLLPSNLLPGGPVNQTMAPIQQPIAHFAARGLADLATPENALLAATGAEIGPIALRLLGAYFGSQAVPESINAFRQGDTETGLLRGLEGGLMLGGSVIPERARTSGIEGNDIPSIPTPKLLPNIAPSSPRFIGLPGGQILDVSKRELPVEQAATLQGAVQKNLRGVGQEVPQQPSPAPSPQFSPQDLSSMQGSLSQIFKGTQEQPQPTKFAKQVVQRALEQILPRQEKPTTGHTLQTQQELGLQSGAIKPEDLRPAINLMGRILIGEPGETHGDILERNGINPDTIPHPDSRRGFVDINNPQAFLNRREAESRSGLKGTADAGGLDSMNLPGAAMARLEREMLKGEKNAIPELRTDSISQTQPSSNIQAMEQEVRQGAGTTRPTQEEQAQGQGELFQQRGITGASEFAKMRAAAEGNQAVVHEADRKVIRDAETRQPLNIRQAVRKASYYEPAIKAPNGEIWTGPGHFEIRAKGIQGQAGYLTKNGEFMSLTDIARREQQGQYMKDVREIGDEGQVARAIGQGPTKLGSGVPLPEGDEVDAAANKMRRGLMTFDEIIDKIRQGGKPEDQERLKELQAIRDQIAGNEGGRLYSGLHVPENLGEIPKKIRDFATKFMANRETEERMAQLLDAADNLAKTPEDKRRTHREWINQLGRMELPDGSKVAKRAVRGETSEAYVPREYYGARFLVNKNVVDMFDRLTGESFVSKRSIGRIALQGEAEIKHKLLAFDLFHALRVARRALFLTNKLPEIYLKDVLRESGPSSKGILSVLDYSPEQMQQLRRRGLVDDDTMTLYNARKADADFLMKHGTNVRQWSESSQVKRFMEGAFKVAGVDINPFSYSRRFNHWVFDRVSRSAMLQVGFHILDKAREQHPEWTEDQLGAYVSKQANVYLGNLGRQGLLKSQSARDLSNIAFLAPSWVEGLIQSETRGAKQAVDVVRGKGVGPQLKGIGTGVLAYFVGNQLINMATRNQPTWENKEEGHMFDAWIPDWSGKTAGFWLSPFSDSAEMTHDIIKYGKGRDYSSPMAATGSALATAGRIAQNKLSPLARAEEAIRIGEDYAGRKLTSEERVKEAGRALLPTPLPVAGAFSETPGATQRQLMTTLGFRAEPASKAEMVEGLSLDERLKKVKAEKAQAKKSYDSSSRGASLAAEGNIRRGQDIAKQMSTEDRNWLDQRGLLLPGFDNKITYKKERLLLSPREQRRLEDLVKDNYTQAIKAIRSKYDDVPEENRARFFSEVMSQARAKARASFMKELESGAKSDTNNKRIKGINLPQTQSRWQSDPVVQP